MVAFLPPLCSSCFLSSMPSISDGGSSEGSLYLSCNKHWLYLKLGVNTALDMYNVLHVYLNLVQEYGQNEKEVIIA